MNRHERRAGWRDAGGSGGDRRGARERRSGAAPVTPRRVLATAGLAALLGASLSACSATSTSGPVAGPSTTAGSARAHTKGPADLPSPKDGGKVVMDLEADAEGLDPTRFAFAASGHFIASAVFEPIATLDDDGNAVPYLASAIESSNDNKTWTITMPQGLVFSDGDALDAAAVVANLEAHRKSLITSAALVTVESVQRKGDDVVVDLSKPWAAFPSVMTSQVGYVISPKMLENPDLNRTPIGSGPFVYDSRSEGERWSFKKNPKYRQPGKPHLEALEFRIVADENQRAQDLQDGTADVIHTSRPDSVLSLRASDFKLVDYAEGEEDFIIVNHAKAPFDDKDARLAAAHAIDAERWRKESTKGVEQPANSPFAPGQLGYVADNGFPTYDPDEAKRLVEAYEKKTGEPMKLKLLVIDSPSVTADGQYFKDNLEAVGIEVELTLLPQVALIAQTAVGNFDLAMFRNFGFHDPDTDTVFWRTTSAPPLGGVALNFPRFTDPRVAEAIDKATAASDDAERGKAYEDLQKVFAEEIPYIWLGRPNWLLAANPRVNGIYPAANGSIQTLGAKTWLTDLWVA